MQGGILRVSGQDLAHGRFGLVKVLLARLGGGFHQTVWNGGADPRGLGVARTQDAHQVFIRPR